MSDDQTLIPLNTLRQLQTTTFNCKVLTTSFDELLNFVYPDMTEDARKWNGRAILATTNNATIDACNEHISSKRPEQSLSFFSSDSLISDEPNPNTAFAAPEHLNQLNVSGVPPHELKLKSNTLAMLGPQPKPFFRTREWSKVCSPFRLAKQSCNSGQAPNCRTASSHRFHSQNRLHSDCRETRHHLFPCAISLARIIRDDY